MLSTAWVRRTSSQCGCCTWHNGVLLSHQSGTCPFLGILADQVSVAATRHFHWVGVVGILTCPELGLASYLWYLL